MFRPVYSRKLVEYYADVLSPCVIRKSASVLFTIEDKRVLYGFQLPNTLSELSNDNKCKYIFLLDEMNSAEALLQKCYPSTDK